MQETEGRAACRPNSSTTIALPSGHELAAGSSPHATGVTQLKRFEARPICSGSLYVHIVWDVEVRCSIVKSVSRENGRACAAFPPKCRKTKEEEVCRQHENSIAARQLRRFFFERKINSPQFQQPFRVVGGAVIVVRGG
ncbi:hypothetical protein TNCV_3849221 [Trichonephila clavipes]|uniref:Uncharacterized protein n=1 Tax=Trichonephila clavipes TaxID=2585209 RepID=A0A8X6V039_TRICX|nr:hypothetical protein TNCV_3849221 [Trichonephila clavipes]